MSTRTTTSSITPRRIRKVPAVISNTQPVFFDDMDESDNEENQYDQSN